MTTTNLYEMLSEPFPEEMEKTLRKGGASLTYIPVSEVITRLNKVFGVDGWSSEIISCGRDEIDPDFIVAKTRLIVFFEKGGMPIIKDGVGGQKIKRTKAGEIVDLGDEMKGAVSDALKKAAQQLGVGLYLARDVEAIETEHAQDAYKEVSPTAKLYENFVGLRDKLDDAQRKNLRDWWSGYSGGRPIPKSSEFTEQELEDLVVEVSRMLLDATVTVEVAD
jgi:hypothetical protein